MLRLLVTSEAFKRNAAASPEGKVKDPENRLLQRYPARRLEAGE